MKAQALALFLVEVDGHRQHSNRLAGDGGGKRRQR